MKDLKEYKRPKISIIKISFNEQLLAGSDGDIGDYGDDFIKAQNFRIIDDSDDWSDEDY